MGRSERADRSSGWCVKPEEIQSASPSRRSSIRAALHKVVPCGYYPEWQLLIGKSCRLLGKLFHLSLWSIEQIYSPGFSGRRVSIDEAVHSITRSAQRVGR